jgi:L-threonylcarbamoyladenylate synthase
VQSIQSWQIKHAVRAVRAGAIIAYPTEAVFGLGCDPENPDALWRLLALKQRPVEKGLILIASSLEQLAPYLAPMEKDIEEKILSSWPGPVTWLLPARDDVSPLLRGAHKTIAVRVTAHPVARALCQALGHPLVSTSANIANGRPARDSLTVRRLFGDTIDYLVPGRVGDLKRPTEIRDARSDSIVRA